MSDKSREIREKYKNLQHEYTRVSTENKFLTEECTKRKYIIFLLHQRIIALPRFYYCHIFLENWKND